MIKEEKPRTFKGKLRKIRIVSNNICYGPRPEPYDEVEQRITINSAGRVWYSSYNYGNGFGRYEKAYSRCFSISKEVTEKIMCAFSNCFGGDYLQVLAFDFGEWEMELTSEDGEIYKFNGPLCADYKYEGVDLSDMVREALDMEDLYVLDGNYQEDDSE